MATTPFIPESITVHLGPPDSAAQNVTVPFVDYLKNVAASEIYPTWPENALRANIYAQISFALNRIYTEWYRSRGYDFDITNTTAFDQSYTYGRDTFQTTDRIVEELFNDYIVRQGNIEPLFAQFCNGTTSTCEGLSQWGTVDLANQGLTPFSILTNYYGDDIGIVADAPIREAVSSYPGSPLRRGSSGNDVRILQVRLNRISNNYPAIPKIPNVNGVYDVNTEAAVRKFQEIFNLTTDGVAGKATWYRINGIFNGVKRLSELDSEGLRLQDVSKLYSESLQRGSTGTPVEVIQYYLSVLSLANPEILNSNIDGNFNEQTEASVRSFQRFYGITEDGVVGRETWNAITDAYRGALDSLPQTVPELAGPLFPGSVLTEGDTGQSVEILQYYLNRIGEVYEITPVTADGVFGPQTSQAIIDFKRIFDIEPLNNAVAAATWYRLASVYSELVSSGSITEGIYPGRISTQ